MSTSPFDKFKKPAPAPGPQPTPPAPPPAAPPAPASPPTSLPPPPPQPRHPADHGQAKSTRYGTALPPSFPEEGAGAVGQDPRNAPRSPY